MKFEWDEIKNIINRQNHGIGFEEAQEIFGGLVLTWIDNRQNYGEIRELSIGAIEEIIVVLVVHTKRRDKIRIISARKAKRKERERYYAYLEEALR